MRIAVTVAETKQGKLKVIDGPSRNPKELRKRLIALDQKKSNGDCVQAWIITNYGMDGRRAKWEPEAKPPKVKS